MESNEIKRMIARYASDLVKDQQVVGLGSGSTASFFIQELGKRVREGLQITAVASSLTSQNLATQANIPLVDIEDISNIDIAFDGADAVNDKKEMIKGRGGALFREKIIAYAAEEYIIMIEEKKWVQDFHNVLVPIEVVFFGKRHTQKRIEQLGYRGTWRKNQRGELFVTDNGNNIFDVFLSKGFSQEDNDRLKGLLGVVDTGFFSSIAHKIIVGTERGKIEIKY